MDAIGLVEKIDNIINEDYKIDNTIFENVFFEQLQPEKNRKGFMVFAEKVDNFEMDALYPYRRRYYYVEKLNDNENGKKIIFVLFNCSTSNPDKLDATVKNCGLLAKKNNYSQIEVLNLFSVRNSNVDEINEDDLINDDFNFKFITELLKSRKNCNIVLAWGYGKESKKMKSSKANKDIIIVNKIEKFRRNISNFKTHNNIKYLSYKFDTEEKDNYLKQRHPGNFAWNSIGGFKNFAVLTDYNEQ